MSLFSKLKTVEPFENTTRGIVTNTLKGIPGAISDLGKGVLGEVKKIPDHSFLTILFQMN